MDDRLTFPPSSSSPLEHVCMLALLSPLCDRDLDVFDDARLDSLKSKLLSVRSSDDIISCVSSKSCERIVSEMSDPIVVLALSLPDRLLFPDFNHSSSIAKDGVSKKSSSSELLLIIILCSTPVLQKKRGPLLLRAAPHNNFFSVD